MPFLDIDNVHKSFARQVVVAKFNLGVAERMSVDGVAAYRPKTQSKSPTLGGLQEIQGTAWTFIWLRG
jgi:hypothetical protein